mmetsp:Transcript_7686/g.20411  ORF Transcript_7686/g.20411 Transcript_7686/m.20411 type:complete len:230 (-) Transcript_7686:675-1364(-)
MLPGLHEVALAEAVLLFGTGPLDGAARAGGRRENGLGPLHARSAGSQAFFDRGPRALGSSRSRRGRGCRRLLGRGRRRSERRRRRRRHRGQGPLQGGDVRVALARAREEPPVGLDRVRQFLERLLVGTEIRNFDAGARRPVAERAPHEAAAVSGHDELAPRGARAVDEAVADDAPAGHRHLQFAVEAFLEPLLRRERLPAARDLGGRERRRNDLRAAHAHQVAVRRLQI